MSEHAVRCGDRVIIVTNANRHVITYPMDRKGPKKTNKNCKFKRRSPFPCKFFLLFGEELFFERLLLCLEPIHGLALAILYAELFSWTFNCLYFF